MGSTLTPLATFDPGLPEKAQKNKNDFQPELKSV